MDWSSLDYEEEIDLSTDGIDTIGQSRQETSLKKVKNSRRAIEIIKEQQQLREMLRDFRD